MNEESGRPRHNFEIKRPDILDGVDAAIDGINIVAREPQTGYNGRLHKDTTYGLSKVDGQLKIRERVAVDKKLTLKHLERFRDSSDKGHLKEILVDWVRGEHNGPHPTWKYGTKPDGTEDRRDIKKITLITKENPEVVYPRLTAEIGGENQPFATYARSEMVRIDVFENVNDQVFPKYVLVPVYAHQTSASEPPNQYCKRSSPYSSWPKVDRDYDFVTSLTKLDAIRIRRRNRKKPKNEQIEELICFFRGLDIDDASIAVSPVFTLDKKLEVSLGPTDLLFLEKLKIARTGKIAKEERKTRTWRGKVCM